MPHLFEGVVFHNLVKLFTKELFSQKRTSSFITCSGVAVSFLWYESKQLISSVSPKYNLKLNLFVFLWSSMTWLFITTKLIMKIFNDLYLCTDSYILSWWLVQCIAFFVHLPYCDCLYMKKIVGMYKFIINFIVKFSEWNYWH